MMKRIIILKSQDGDWEGLYVDGNLIEEGHILGEGNNRMFLLEQAEKFNFTSKDVEWIEVNNEDDFDLLSFGSFPETLSELSGDYGNYSPQK